VFALIAARSLLRNRRRTAIVVGGAAFSVLAFVFLFGFFDGFFAQLIENSTRYLTGHVQIERAGFRRDLAPELALEEPTALLERLRRVPGVAAAAPRAQAQALVSSAAKSEGVLLIGIEPELERRVTFIHRTIVEGAALEPRAEREIMIGRRLARKLGVRLGEKVVLTAQAADGELGTAALRVSGIFATESAAFDGAIAFVTLPAARSLLALGARASTINVRLEQGSEPARTIEALRGALGAPGLALAPWQELLPQLEEMVRLNEVLGDIILAMLLLVVATAIMNTVFMMVAERTREFGVLMALGTPPAAIRRMVVYETIALLGLALLLGYGAGIVLVEFFGRQGIDLSGFFRGYSALPGLTGIVYPKLILGNVLGPGVALLLAGVLASLYPASLAARLDPARALRHA
jgi:ABC-type lipoprotein release transport system permease subunit